MKRASCEVVSERAGRYMLQLCKHFAHKIPVEYDDIRGRADFPMGTCDMEVDGNSLQLICGAETEEALAKIQLIVEDHIVRFAWRDEPTIVWRPVSAGDP